MGYRQIILKIDSLMVVKMVSTSMDCLLLMSTLVFYCRDLLPSAWRVIPQHTYREANSCTNFLANKERTQKKSLTTYETCPTFLYQYVIWDMRHMTYDHY